MFIKKIIVKEKKGLLGRSTFPILLPSLFNFEFFVFVFCTKSNGIEKLTQDHPKCSSKNLVKEKNAWWRIVVCRKHHGKLFMFSPGQGRAWRNHMFTMLGRAWRKHIFSIPGLVTLKPEPGENMSNFTWYFQTPLAQYRSFAFQYLIANIVKAYPFIYFFFYTLTISRFLNLKKKKKKRKNFEMGGRRTRKC